MLFIASIPFCLLHLIQGGADSPMLWGSQGMSRLTHWGQFISVPTIDFAVLSEQRQIWCQVSQGDISTKLAENNTCMQAFVHIITENNYYIQPVVTRLLQGKTLNEARKGRCFERHGCRPGCTDDIPGSGMI
jgi:hypothetical protein